MAEYAIIRFMLVWTIAVTFPNVMVTAASAASAGEVVSDRNGSPPRKTLMIAAKAAASEPVIKKAEIGVGAPW